MSQVSSDEQGWGRIAYWVFGLAGSAVLVVADALARLGSLRYSESDVTSAFHTVAFLAVLGCGACGVLGVVLARARPTFALWLLRLAAAGALVAGLYAVFNEYPWVGVGLIVFAGFPLFVASWAVGWAERPTEP